ncbi:MAG: hydrogenase iron-sulfur subunit [Deltaproteobacteria bacterium]|nr:hydrogenase iron-sulfur subunit [Deltaproteobacteria bacterium]
MRHLTVIQEPRVPVEESRPDPKLRGDGALAALEVPFLWLDRAIERLVPAKWNPLAQTGAIANVTFLIASISGVLLLIWYRSSVHSAWSSLEAMRGSFLAQLTRSIHRYSSDACMLFVVLHAVRLTAARRFSGARWLAWVTGLILIGSLWLVGWLGYWLVWDEAARQVAIGSSKVLDVLPIFGDPMGRSFLTDGSVHSLLFFIVFFLHMLLPLAMGIALWLHITRLNRSRFLTSRGMAVAIVAALVVLSIVAPATSGKSAKMLVSPSAVSLDAFYLLPIAITDRLGGGLIWAVTLLGGIVSFSIPWALSRGRAPVAKVDLAKCNGCTNCAADCPYDAITMVARTDGRDFARQAVVDAAKCVGCGVCAGSCDSAGIGIPAVSQVEARGRIDRWIDEVIADEEDALVAFVCQRSAGAAVKVDPESGRSDALPGYRVMPVVCTGWVHALTVERALRHGAKGVLLVGCGRAEPPTREGTRWTHERIEGARKPALRADKVDAARVRLLELDRTRASELNVEAEAFRTGAPRASRAPARALRAIAAVGVAAVLSGATLLGSRVGYGGPPSHGPELVVSFKHPGRTGEHCRRVTEEEKAKMPPHMRRDEICERGRAAVRLRVEVDGQERWRSSYAPQGLRGDGPSIALETLGIQAGEHRVVVSLGDSHDPNEWTFRDERTLRFGDRSRAVVLFDRGTGFTWETGESP